MSCKSTAPVASFLAILVLIVCYSASICAFVKCSQLPVLASGDFTREFTQTALTRRGERDVKGQNFLTLPDDASALIIWGVAETSVTIIATTIPVMRVLVRDVTSAARSKLTGQSATAGGTTYGRSGGISKLSGLTKTENSTIVTSTGHHMMGKDEISFLDDSAEPSPLLVSGDGRQILQTNEVSVKWSRHGRRPAGAEYELGPV